MMSRIDPQDPQLIHRVRDRLVTAGEPPTPSRVARALRADGAVLGDAAVLAVTATLRSELLGMGPIEPLLATPGVTDVLVNGPDEVWLDEGHGLRRCEVRFPTAESVRRLATRLAVAAGLRLDETSPFVELVLEDGARVHCALPPIAPNGPLVSIRVPPRRTLALEELVVREWAPREAVPWLSAILGSRCNVLVTGGTGSGKTTVLSSLLSRVDADDRLLLIEDSSELRPEHPHVVRLLTRVANVEGVGAVTIRDLVRQALRMRPDRIVVGEVRGAEVVDWLAAMNTGHSGCCGTMHANRVEDVGARLEALGVTAGLGREAVQTQAAAALDVVLHLVRDRDGHRRLSCIGAVATGDSGRLEVRPGLLLARDGTIVEGPSSAALERRLAAVA